jgi:hypothetical protein
LIEPAAGWENEKSGNDDFDAKEYIDLMTSAGYGLAVMYDRGGRALYCETFPEACLTTATEKRVHEARGKFCAASTAVERVKAECIRRGLIDRG